MESLSSEDLVNLLSQFNISQEGISEFENLGIEGQTFTWLEADDIKSIFSKMSDQLKVKAMIAKLKNSTIIIEPEKVSVKQEEIQFIDESPKNNVDSNQKKSDDDEDETFDSDSDSEGESSGDENVPLPVKLPTFSNTVEKGLVKGDIWQSKKTRCQLINELSVFFTSKKDYKLKTSKDYKAIGLTLLHNYKAFRSFINELCDSANTNIQKENLTSVKKKKLIQPWRLVTRPLSNKVRNIRYSCNKNAKINEKNLKLFEHASVISSKTSTVDEKAGNTSSLFSPPSSRRLLNLSLKAASNNPSGSPKLNKALEYNSVRVPNDNHFSPCPVKRKINSACDKSKDDNKDDKKLKIESYGQTLHKKLRDVSKKNIEAQEMLIWIELSHSYRRDHIQKSSDLFLNLFCDFKYLSDIKCLLTEFSLIIKSPIDELKGLIRKIMLILFKQFNVKAKSELEGFIKCIQAAEKEIKVKGCQSILLIEKNGTEIQSNTVEAPRIYINNDEIQIIFFDKCSSISLLKETCNCIIDALVILYSFYFSFDINYPECFKQILVLFHSFLFKNFKNGFNQETNNYIQLRSIIEKNFI